jgi:hypothetical protein
MPLDLHRCGDGEDPLVVLVPHLDADVTRIPLCQPALPNLSR